MDADQPLPQREWLCPGCKRRNPLFAVVCPACTHRLSEDEARAQDLWGREDGLPEPVRRAFQAARLDEERRRLEYEEYLRRRQIRDAAVGAGVALLSQVLLACLAESVLFPLVFLPLGAGAGYTLNRARGGRLPGLGLYVSAFVASWIVAIAVSGTRFLDQGAFAAGFFVFSVTGLALASVSGFFHGLVIEFDRFDRGV